MRVRLRFWNLLASLVAGAALAVAAHDSVDADPLIEKIVRSADAEIIAAKRLFDLAADANVVYLGEKHDNPRHHEIQARVVEALIRRGRKPILAFEYFHAVESGFLLDFVAGRTGAGGHGARGTAEERLRERLSHRTERSRTFEFYLSLLRLAREHGLGSYGIDLPPALRSRLARLGRGGLTEFERSLLFPTRDRGPAYRRLMISKLREAHCGYGSDDYLGRLYETWVARNDAMAAAIVRLAESAGGEPIVVFLGSGHVQHNKGVVAQVAANRPDLAQINIGMREVSGVPAEVRDYLDAPVVDGVRFGPDHDYYWFTSRFGSGDPCASFVPHGATGPLSP